jgi:hypothetical protein
MVDIESESSKSASAMVSSACRRTAGAGTASNFDFDVDFDVWLFRDFRGRRDHEFSFSAASAAREASWTIAAATAVSSPPV